VVPARVAVLEALGGKVLRPAVIVAIIDGVLSEMTPKALTRTFDTLKQQIAEVDRALANLSRAIAEGGPLDALLAELKTRQADRNRLVADLHRHEGARGHRIDRRQIERQVRQHVAEWRALLSTKQIVDGRLLLRECLSGPIRFVPKGKTYEFDGKVGLDRIVGGIAGLATKLASLTGFVPTDAPKARRMPEDRRGCRRPSAARELASLTGPNPFYLTGSVVRTAA
jgi:hypothetical protein